MHVAGLFSCLLFDSGCHRPLELTISLEITNLLISVCNGAAANTPHFLAD